MFYKGKGFISSLFIIWLLGVSHSVFAVDYFVSKQGDNNNTCLNNSTDSCLSIQRALSLAVAGDTVHVSSGTYVEDSHNSPYTKKCSWMGGIPASICIRQDGTPNNPITLRVASGSEGNVTIDSELKRVGFQLFNHDYIHVKGFRFINNYIAAITSWGQTQNRIADPTKLSIGVVFEDNYIYNTNGVYGSNIAGVHMWGTKDWIVRNNFINYVTRDGALSISHTSGIQAYGTINALVENNHVVNASAGVLWKDHFVADASGTPLFESEIRYNLFETNGGINIIAMGAGSDEAGINYIHHNIFSKYTGAAITANISHALALSTGLRIEHNIFYGASSTKSVAVSNDAVVDHTMKGNIFINNKSDVFLVYENQKAPKLTYSDFNIFEENSANFSVDVYSGKNNAGASKNYRSLSDWQAADKADTESLAASNPDTNSVEAAISNLFIDADVLDYRYPASSTAIGFMPDGSNAGPYQKGDEVIGLLPANYKLPLPPVNLVLE